MCRAIRPAAPSREFRWVAWAPPWARPGLEADPVCSSITVGPGVDPGDDRHAGAQTLEKSVCVVDRDFDGNALNHLGEISCRIVGRQEGELRAGAGREREHVTAQAVARKS